jgi:hypothetical protein
MGQLVVPLHISSFFRIPLPVPLLRLFMLDMFYSLWAGLENQQHHYSIGISWHLLLWFDLVILLTLIPRVRWHHQCTREERSWHQRRQSSDILGVGCNVKAHWVTHLVNEICLSD